MHRYELRVDVSTSIGMNHSCEMAISVYVPQVMPDAESQIVVFAFPGGGYSRGYFDIQFETLGEYSQARYHTARGVIFVAVDHVGVGDSTIPEQSEMWIERLADANAALMNSVSSRLADGSLITGLAALPTQTVIGIGQSMGGCLTIVAQARHSCCDGIAVLGYSAIHTSLPQRDRAFGEWTAGSVRVDRSTPVTDIQLDVTQHIFDDYLYPFHWEDVPQAIIDADIGGGYPIRLTAPAFGSSTTPACAVQMLAPGCVAAEAASVQVPVFIGAGERDVCESAHREPAAYQAANDVTVAVIPTMAHMHNFASTREALWLRLQHWFESVRDYRIAGQPDLNNDGQRS